MLSETQKAIYKAYNLKKEPRDEITNKILFETRAKVKGDKQSNNVPTKECLKPWIDFNTNKGKEAPSDFEKDMCKLMNNAIFSKTMKYVREHITFELIDTPEQFQNVGNAPTYQHRHIINENLVGAEKRQETVKRNKPIYVGMSILDSSKLHITMY